MTLICYRIYVYGGEDGGLDKGVTPSMNSGVWSSIASLNRSLAPANLSLGGLFSKSLGCRSNTKFWKDVWCGDRALIDRFPRLASLDKNSNCSIAERCATSNNGKTFMWDWKTNLRGESELAALQTISELCNNVNLGIGEDSWKWELETDGR